MVYFQNKFINWTNCKYFIDPDGYLYLIGGEQKGKITCEKAALDKLEFQMFDLPSLNEIFQNNENFKEFRGANLLPQVLTKKEYQNSLILNKQINEETKYPNFFIFGSETNRFILKLKLNAKEVKSKKVPENLALFSYQGLIKLQNKTENYFLTGGITDDIQKPQKICQIYDAKKNSVEKLPDMPEPRWAAQLLQKDHFIYVIGGRLNGVEDSYITNTCLRFDLQLKEWVKIANMNKKRSLSCVKIINDKIIIAGGINENGLRLQSFEVYNEKFNVWEMMGLELYQGLEASQMIEIKQQESHMLLFLGGRTDQGDQIQVQGLDIKNGFDISIPVQAGNMQIERRCHKILNLNNNSYLIFGGSIFRNYSVEYLVYDEKKKQLINSKKLNKFIEQFNKQFIDVMKLPISDIQKFSIS
ncbi:hypothetical protein PPERSA_05037 [Pseudocohnilembus persalinus]|uniref:Galactose oxidase/kelch, beta-propeller n=1 Tax=Pseudocohnilembus persalinus TaxID=266149 RepID=A0A0V0QWW5_PSEPJ|nr:hypothetical protein PPERSA_05037 [Pseudocohnilembus persalinus]|eukprot:KRX06424.1 hypothetical protein PPERSA_05037 [Pseudocohnilembus persalinus]